MQKQFQNRTVKKSYYAIVVNAFNEKQIFIDLPINRHIHDRKKMQIHHTGRNAQTIIKVIKNFANFSLIDIELLTGRTHQIRVHLQYINHPVLGDKIYGHKKYIYEDNIHYLHAHYLAFEHPVTNQKMEFETNLPEYFLKKIHEMEIK